MSTKTDERAFVNFFGIGISVPGGDPDEAYTKLCALLMAAGFEFTTDGYQVFADGMQVTEEQPTTHLFPFPEVVIEMGVTKMVEQPLGELLKTFDSALQDEDSRNGHEWKNSIGGIECHLFEISPRKAEAVCRAAAEQAHLAVDVLNIL